MNRFLLTSALAIAGYHTYRALKPRYDYRGKHVAITGGSRGLGLVIARELAAKGAKISICSRHADDLSLAGADLSRRGAQVVTVECDLRQPDDVRRFLRTARQRLGPVDVLIHNAGVIQAGPLEEMTEADFRESLEVHFWAGYHAMQEVVPEMKVRNQGRIVNIASVGGKIAVPHLLPYVTGKFALVGFSDGLRAELAKYGITVTTVCPGLMRTGSHLNAEFKGRHEEEYAWFALGNATPGLSVNAERAARQIIDACAIGDAELVIGLSAKLGIFTRTMMPNLTATLFEAVNKHVLPEPGGIGKQRLTGHDSRGKLNSAYTTLSDRASVENNELKKH